PSPIDCVRRPIGGYQCAQQDVGVQDNVHQCSRDHCRASSMRSLTSVSDLSEAAALACSTACSNRYVRTASSMKRDKSPLRPPPCAARYIRTDWSVSGETAIFQRTVFMVLYGVYVYKCLYIIFRFFQPV